MTFIEILLRLMKDRQITAYQLEKDIGIKQATLGKWKTGSLPSIDKLLNLVNYFQVSSDYLLGINNINLSRNDIEMLELFKQITEREQLKYIARLEDEVEKNIKIKKEGELSDSKIG